ncbi:MAG TPA: bacteriohemerythrin [Bryobacteraceae bacterium]|nr:bacteriohemerythrin [Bryobacteraceae bacterium]
MATAHREVVEWKQEYSVHIPSIDKQHRSLVAIIGHLQTAMLEGRTKQIIAPLFQSMNQYTKFHFEYEEQLLEQNGFPDLAAHRQEHARLVQQLKLLEAKYLNGSLNAGAPLMQFLRNWLLDHICAHDKGYSEYLREKGVG